MMFFNGFMLALGLICYATIIFAIAYKITPMLMNHDIAKAIYDFIVGTDYDDVNEVYETD